ncbi:SMC-Scp complex subunit ScpB [Bifidobacterium aemilianum]|uniref:SMC-Scp complex subunit ScpB n=1 Tax=Bifidobacterium aemilianum TaxID=2493120 RepID=UPI0038B3292B
MALEAGDAPGKGVAPVAAGASRPEYVDFNVEDFPGGLRACLEAILMVTDQPQQAEDLARVLAVDQAAVDEALKGLQADYGGDCASLPDPTASGPVSGRTPRGFELRHTARGWQYANRVDFEPVVSAFVSDGQTARLSQAALEALAIVAYRQPVTRAQIAAIRGVNSDGVVRSLNVRGLIREEGADAETRAAFLVTTPMLLEKLGLESLDQLPSLAPFMPSESSLVPPAVQED